MTRIFAFVLLAVLLQNRAKKVIVWKLLHDTVRCAPFSILFFFSLLSISFFLSLFPSLRVFLSTSISNHTACIDYNVILHWPVSRIKKIHFQVCTIRNRNTFRLIRIICLQELTSCALLICNLQLFQEWVLFFHIFFAQT